MCFGGNLKRGFRCGERSYWPLEGRSGDFGGHALVGVLFGADRSDWQGHKESQSIAV